MEHHDHRVDVSVCHVASGCDCL